MDDWCDCTLGDFVTLKRGYDLPKQNRRKGIFPILSSSGISGFHDEYMVPSNGVVTGRYGTIGEVFYCIGPHWPLNTTLFVDNFNGNDKKFVYYLMKTINWKGFSIASAVPGINRNHVHTIPVHVPSIKTQRIIAATLSALDDKIENNNRINHHLEQIAQAIFKSWFVDFEPWGGVIPDDWCLGILSDLLQLVKQPVKAGEQPGLYYVPIDTIPMRSLALNDFRPNNEAQSSLIAFTKNDVLVGAMRVYFHRVSIAPFDGITRTTCFVLRPRDTTYIEYSLLLCNEDNTIEYAQNTSKGSTMPYAVWENGLANMPILIPTSYVLREFSEMLRPVIHWLRDSIFETHNLKTLRDTLLPRLLSGELTLSDLTDVS